MKKFTYMLAALAITASATMTSCVKDSETPSVEAIRGAKAEQLKALASLQKAQGEAALVQANAEKVLKEAEAKLKASEAALQQAKAEYQLIQNKDAEARLDAAKADYEFQKQNALSQLAGVLHQMELDKMTREIAMNAAKMEMELALANQTNFKLREYYQNYVALIGANPNVPIFDWATERNVLYNGLAYLSDQIVVAKNNLFNAEWDLVTDNREVLRLVEEKNQTIATQQALVVTYKAQKDLGYDGFLAEAKKYNDLVKADEVKLQGLSNAVSQAEAAYVATSSEQNFGKPNGVMYDAEFAVAARFLNTFDFPVQTGNTWGTQRYTIVLPDSYEDEPKAYEVLGHKATLNSGRELDYFKSVDAANLKLQVDNFETSYKTFVTQQIERVKRDLADNQAQLDKYTKLYNDSLALRDTRVNEKEASYNDYVAKDKIRMAAESAKNASVQKYQDQSEVAPTFARQNVGDATAVDAAIVNTKTYPDGPAKTKELELLSTLKSDYASLSVAQVASDKAYAISNNASQRYSINKNTMDQYLANVNNFTTQVNMYKSELEDWNLDLNGYSEILKELKANQSIVTDAAKLATYNELFGKAKEAMSALCDAKIAKAILSIEKNYHFSLGSFYAGLAQNILGGQLQVDFKNMLDENIKLAENAIADAKHAIEELEKFGNDATVDKKKRVEFYKARLAALEAEYQNTQKVADAYKKLLDAELAK